jgi:CRISPR type IV-associated protein Csf3
MVYCLKIELGAPVAASDPYIHLDSFVAYAAAVESVGHDGIDELEDGGEPEYWEDEMPFERYEVGDEWVWATTSAGIAHPYGDGDSGEPERWNTTRWRTHFDHDPEHQIKETHVNTSSGEFKSYNAALPYAATDSLTFFFEGDADRVVELIEEHVPAVGKKRSQGFGRIRDVQVTSAEGAVESAIYHNGRVLRSLPATFAPTVVSGITYERRTVRPPYWHQANQAMAYPPFVDVPRENFEDELGLAEVPTA